MVRSFLCSKRLRRIFLLLMGYRDETRQRRSDCTCTALQLANFWQDVGVDYLKGRIYVPLEDMERFFHTLDGIVAALLKLERLRADGLKSFLRGRKKRGKERG